jgi:hypothetical protein
MTQQSDKLLPDFKATKGFKRDLGKVRFDLLPSDVLTGVARVCTPGIGFKDGKYPARNWELGMSWGRYFSAAMRHAWAFWQGEELDHESGEPHLAHAIANLMFLYAYYLRNIGTDDRTSIERKMS